MKNYVGLVSFLLLGNVIFAQTLTLRHEVQFPSVNNSQGQVGSSDCWGWTDSLGVDYAFIGNSDHVAFVRASDGVVLDTVQLASGFDAYYHRDFKTKGHYCYAVCEMRNKRDGLCVIDLQYLPDSVHFVTNYDAGGTLYRSHNLDRDEGRPYLYLEGDENLGSTGIEIINISDPENPFKEGFILVPNTHDMNARNDTVWVAEGYSKAYSIYDCTDKGNPILLGRVPRTTFGYCHNIWPSDDGKFFFTTEETVGKTIKVWDATDMNNIVERGSYISTNGLAHNVHVMGDLLIISHYTSGVTVVDWSDPDAPVELARYDTYTASDAGNFFGCWGTFPFTQNGYIYGSNLDGRLFILDWDRNGVVAADEQQGRAPGLCWPNPFVATTNIPLALDATQMVQVTAYDMAGRLVETIFEGELAAGNYTLPWHPAAGLATGTYNVHIAIGTQSRTVRLVLKRG